MARVLQTTGWSMFPTVAPGEQIRVEPAHPSTIDRGDVAAVFGTMTRCTVGEDGTDNWAVTDRPIVMTHRVIDRSEEAVLTTGDLDLTSEWERDSIDSVVGRVVEVSGSPDSSIDRDLERDLLRLCWYWETLARVVCNSRTPGHRERLVPLLVALVDAAVARCDGRDESVLSVTPAPSSAGEVRLFGDAYGRVVHTLERHGGELGPHRPGREPQDCWHRADEVRFRSLGTDADRSTLRNFCRRARRDRATVLPLPADDGPMVYPTVAGEIAYTPCLECRRSDPACRRSGRPAGSGKFLSDVAKLDDTKPSRRRATGGNR